MATLVIEDKFPATTGFVLGGDNTAAPKGNGEYMEFELGTSEGRTELSVNNGTAPQKWTEGETMLCEYELTVTAPYGYGASGKHNTISQLPKGLGPPGNGSGSPGVAIELSNYHSEGNGLYLVTEGATEKAAEKLLLGAASVEGKAVLVQVWVYVSKKALGKVLVYLGGKKILEKTGMNTLQTTAEYGFDKVGIYKGSSSSSCKIKIRNYRLYTEAAWGPEGEPPEEPPPEEEPTGPPKEVETLAATAVAETSATLHGKVNPNGLTTLNWFRWSTTDPTLETYNATADVETGKGTAQVATSANLSGIAAGTKVYFKQGAENSKGKVFGSVLNFTTESEPEPEPEPERSPVVISAAQRATRGLVLR